VASVNARALALAASVALAVTIPGVARADDEAAQSAARRFVEG
jgi:hypothetical protein